VGALAPAERRPPHPYRLQRRPPAADAHHRHLRDERPLPRVRHRGRLLGDRGLHGGDGHRARRVLPLQALALEDVPGVPWVSRTVWRKALRRPAFRPGGRGTGRASTSRKSSFAEGFADLEGQVSLGHWISNGAWTGVPADVVRCREATSPFGRPSRTWAVAHTAHTPARASRGPESQTTPAPGWSKRTR